MAPTLETRYAFTITVRIAEVTTAGDTGHGVRRIIPIIGGEVRGEKVNGNVLPFGADFQIIRPNELIDLEAKYAFETDDGAVVYIDNRGIRFGPVELLQKLGERSALRRLFHGLRGQPDVLAHVLRRWSQDVGYLGA